MTLFTKENITKYLMVFSLILITSIIGKKFKHYFDDEGYSPNEYKLIKRYLLNTDSNPYNSGKPNLWIHTKYEINSRKWKSFGSRNTFDLNQPYLHLTIKSIIYHCEKSFNICLIDDNTFEKLIPNWNIKMEHLAEPYKSYNRDLGLLQLLHEYGGMLIPNSFLCFNDLINLYSPEKLPFVSEKINNTTQYISYVPDIRFMGANKKSPIIKDLINFLNIQYKKPHFSSENDLIGIRETWLITQIKERNIKLLSGDMIGIMTKDKKAILLDNLMEENYLDLSNDALGIFIPADDILKRQKYQWFSVISSEEILNGSTILNKYFIKTIGDILEHTNKTNLLLTDSSYSNINIEPKRTL